MPSFNHTVHFWLKPEVTDEQKAEFVKGLKALAESPSVPAVRVATPAGTPREVVDNSYDYQLLISFPSKEAHDAYQSADDPAHQHFIKTYRVLFAKVLIFDSIEV